MSTAGTFGFKSCSGTDFQPRPDRTAIYFAIPAELEKVGRQALDLAAKLGDTLVRTNPIPPAFAATMGNTAYLLRHRQLGPLLEAIRIVQLASA